MCASNAPWSQRRKTNRCVVLALSGNGRAFCAGDDLSAMRLAATIRCAAAGSISIWAAGRPSCSSRPLSYARVQSPRSSCCTVTRWARATITASPATSASLPRMSITAIPAFNRALWAAEAGAISCRGLVNQAAVASIAYLGETMDGNAAYERGLVHAVYAAGADLRRVAKPFLDNLTTLDAAATPTPKPASSPPVI